AEAADRLRGEGDLRYEHDRAQAAFERGLARLEVDLGLAAAGGAVEEEGAAPFVHPGDDAIDGGALLGRELGGCGLAAAEGVALGRRCLRVAPRALARRDELERPG